MTEKQSSPLRSVALALLCAAFVGGSAAVAQQGAQPSVIAKAPPGTVRVIVSNGLRLSMEAVRAQAEKAIGKKLVIEYGSSRSLQPEIESGQAYELAILTREVIDDLSTKGKVVAGSRVDLASVPIGLTGTAAGSKLDISTPDAVKKALLGAKVIKYLSTGAARPTVDKTFTMLGVTDAVKAKVDESGPRLDSENPKMTGGDYALVLNLASEFVPTPGWTYLGNLPTQLQAPSVMSAGVGPGGDRQAAAALIKFLQGPAIEPSLKTNRMSRDIPPPLVVAQAARPPAPPKLDVHTVVDGRVYWVGGGGGNAGIVIGDNGVLVIDAKTTPDAGRALVAEVAKLTPKPITHVAITHSDGDHFNGLAGFPDGLKIIGHANNKTELVTTYQFAAVEIDGGRCLPPLNRLPNMIVMKPKVKTVINGVPVEFYYFGPAHTSGDLVVYLPKEKIAFTGDLLTTSVLIHPEKFGSFEGWFKSANGLLALPATRYLGGHANDFDTKDDIRKRIAGYQATKDKADAFIDKGMTLAEVKAAMGDPAKDPSGCRGIPYPSLGQVEYYERTNRDQELK